MKNNAELYNSLFIKEIIRRVHKELIESKIEREKNGEEPIFEVRDLKIEVNFVVTESKETKGGFDFKVITVGGINVGKQKDYTEQQIHKITLSLVAVNSNANENILKQVDESASSFLPRR